MSEEIDQAGCSCMISARYSILREAVEQMFVARDRLDAAPTDSKKAFDEAMRGYRVALDDLRSMVNV